MTFGPAPRGVGFSLIKLASSTMPSNSKLPPGTKAPASGQYRNNTTRTEVTVVRGEPLPPTPKSGQTYTIADKTKHKG
ncbi:MAG: hypothetical protein IV094_09020 [Vitreoscilla sp.]|nr:hypothetical protein [Vitreoscilla sp.]